MSFIRDLVKNLDDGYTTIADDANAAGEFSGYIDTGCLALNALLSGSMQGGIADNKIIAFAGESGVGKTFFALSIAKAFLAKDTDAFVVYYDSEAAVTKKMLQERGIDASRVIIAEPETLEKFKTHAVRLLDAYIEKKKRPKMMMILDSLSMLPTNKEVNDATEGKDVRDMTRSSQIRGIFRTLTLKCAKAKVPMLVNNHVYEAVGSYVPTKTMSGGGGIKYAATTIVELSIRKDKDKETKEVSGIFIRAKQVKGRLSKPDSMVELYLSYSEGLDKFYGLREIGTKHGIFLEHARGWELPDKTMVSKKEMEANPERYINKVDIMERLEAACKKEFLYGTETNETINDQH